MAGQAISSGDCPRESGIAALGLGSSQNDGDRCAEHVRRLLELSHWPVDSAQIQGNEDALGNGLTTADASAPGEVVRAHDAPHAPLPLTWLRKKSVTTIRKTGSEGPLRETVASLGWAVTEKAQDRIDANNSTDRLDDDSDAHW